MIPHAGLIIKIILPLASRIDFMCGFAIVSLCIRSVLWGFRLVILRLILGMIIVFGSYRILGISRMF